MGRIALKVLEHELPNPEALAAVFGLSAELAQMVYPRLRHKLETEPVEEIRIDFEDGYGVRSDAEEDAHAEAAARAMNGGGMPPFLGLRIKALKGATERRGLRTLEHFFTWAQPLPLGFVVTLPKITSPKEVEQLLRNLPHGVGIELMIETTEALECLSELYDAGQGRVTGAHFGPYDFLSSCGIAVVKGIAAASGVRGGAHENAAGVRPQGDSVGGWPHARIAAWRGCHAGAGASFS